MKKVLITGGSSGIGKAFALKYAKLGYAVTIVARKKENLEEVLVELPHNSNHDCLVADLTNEEGRKIVVEKIHTTKYDVLINNAGCGTKYGFTEVPIEDILGMIHLNCDALTVLSHEFLKNAVSGDTLINVGSILSLVAYPSMEVYSATKAFVLSLTKSLWANYHTKGIRILTVCPGKTDTNFFRASGETKEMNLKKRDRQTPEQVVEESLRALENGRIFVVTGWKNKILTFFGAHLPTRISLYFALRW